MDDNPLPSFHRVAFSLSVARHWYATTIPDLTSMPKTMEDVQSVAGVDGDTPVLPMRHERRETDAGKLPEEVPFNAISASTRGPPTPASSSDHAEAFTQVEGAQGRRSASSEEFQHTPEGNGRGMGEEDAHPRLPSEKAEAALPLEDEKVVPPKAITSTKVDMQGLGVQDTEDTEHDGGVLAAAGLASAEVNINVDVDEVDRTSSSPQVPSSSDVEIQADTAVPSSSLSLASSGGDGPDHSSESVEATANPVAAGVASKSGVAGGTDGGKEDAATTILDPSPSSSSLPSGPALTNSQATGTKKMGAAAAATTATLSLFSEEHQQHHQHAHQPSKTLPRSFEDAAAFIDAEGLAAEQAYIDALSVQDAQQQTQAQTQAQALASPQAKALEQASRAQGALHATASAAAGIVGGAGEAVNAAFSLGDRGQSFFKYKSGCKRCLLIVGHLW